MLKKKLPHLQGRRRWLYTCHTAHYQWQTIVEANTIQEARAMGYRDALLVMGNCGKIIKHTINPI